MKPIVFLVLVFGALSAAVKLIHTKLGQRVTLDCGIGNSQGQITWYHGKVLIISILKTGFPLKGNAVMQSRSKVKHGTYLEISGVTREDAGEFHCHIDKSVQSHTLLVFSVSVNPPGPHETGSKAQLQCEVNGLKPDSTVEWKGPGERKNSKSATVDLNPVALSDAGDWLCIATYDNLKLNETLNVKVEDPIPETTSPPQTTKVNKKPPSEDDPFIKWMWIVVGICCAVVIVLVVIVFFLCKRIRRKRKILQMMNARQARRPKQCCQCNRPTAAGKPQQGRQKGRPSALPLQPLLKE